MEVNIESGLPDLGEDLQVNEGVCVQGDTVFQLTGLDGQTIQIPGFMSPRQGRMSIIIPAELLNSNDIKSLDPLLFNITLGNDLPLVLDSTEDLISESILSTYLPPATSTQFEELVVANDTGSVPLSIPKKRGRKRKRTILEDGTFVCMICGEKFKALSEIQNHQRIGHGEKKEFVCDVCGISYHQRDNLLLHQAFEHNEGKLECPMCKRTFSRVASFKAHLFIHMEDDTLKCSECVEEFASTEQLKKHKEVVHRKYLHVLEQAPSAKHPCRICSKIFTNQASFASHMAWHEKTESMCKEKVQRRKKRRSGHRYRNACAECSKTFQKPSQLLRHIRVHTGVKPFSCDTCPAAFNQKGSLQIHIETKHQGIKKFSCDHCGATFGQRGNLKSHLVKAHEDPSENKEQRYYCSGCTCSFLRVASLNCHMTRFHGPSKDAKAEENPELDILQMALRESGLPAEDEENKAAITAGELSENSQTFSEVTISDIKPDGQVKSYNVTLRSDGRTRWHICNVCLKEFKKPSDLIRHFRIHTKEKPYYCHKCHRSFSMKSTLTSHLKTHSRPSAKVLKNFGSDKAVNYCNLCSRNFSTIGQLRVHQRTNIHRARLRGGEVQVSLPEPFIETADGVYEPRMTMKERIVSSSQCASFDERPHGCTICGLRFRKISHLKQHAMQHTGVRPFQCNLCDKKFSKNSVLTVHKKTHLRIKEYTCSVCFAQFSTRGSLKRHLQTFHSEERPFICPFCYKRFKTAVNCKKHMLIHRWTSENDGTHMIPLTKGPAVEVITENSDLNARIFASEATEPKALPPITQDITQENLQDLEQTFNSQLFSTESQPDCSEEVAFAVDNITDPDNLLLDVNVELPNKEGEEQQQQQQLPEVASMFEILTDQAGNMLIQPIGMMNLPTPEIASQSIIEEPVEKPPVAVFICETCSWNASSEKALAKHVLIHQISDLNEDHSATAVRSKPRRRGPFKEFSEAETAELASKELPPDASFSEKILVAYALEKLRRGPEKTKKKKIKFPCTQCDKGFSKHCDLVRHERIHTGERPFQCIHCCRTFAVKSTLVTHLRTHGSRLLFKCHVCQADFSTKSALKIHMRLHTGAKPFMCTICPARFRTSGHLKNHLPSHTKIKTLRPWSNDAINKIADYIASNGFSVKLPSTAKDDEPFNNVPAYQEKENVETGEDPMVSMPDDNIVQLLDPNLADGFLELRTEDGQLVQVFTDMSAVASSAAPTPYATSVDTSPASATPKSRNAFICATCNKPFSKRSLLTRHERVHNGERPFACEICGMSFNQKPVLDSHVKTHYGERPHSCPYCSFTCIQKGNLRAHISRIHKFVYYLESDKKERGRRGGKKKTKAPPNVTVAPPQPPDSLDLGDVRNADLEQVMGELFPQVT